MTDKDKLRIWARDCLLRDEYTCRITGDPATGKVHHIIKRRYQKFRYDPDNGVSVSMEVHEYLEANPKDAVLLISFTIGERLFNKLRERFMEEYGWDYFGKYM